MEHTRFVHVLLTVGTVLSCSCTLQAQDKNYLAIIPPFHSRQELSAPEGMLQLVRQRFVLFVYRNAVAVYSEGDFRNTGVDSMDQELALPSTGHSAPRDEGDERVSNGILSVQIWVEGERIAPHFIHEGNEDWYTIQGRFAPGELKRVKALFWAQTSLTDVDALPGNDTTVIVDGQRGFMVDLCHAAIWKGIVRLVEVHAVFREGLTSRSPLFDAEPDTYDLEDSTLTWEMRDIEPSTGNNIMVEYMSTEGQSPTLNTMAALSPYIVATGYDELTDFARNRLEEE
jgi:hypothetical protein